MSHLLGQWKIAIAVLVLSAGSTFAAIDSTAPLVKVNGQSITERDLRAALSTFNDLQRESVLKDASAKAELLDRLIDQEILSQEAEKAKLDQTQDFKDLMNAFRKQALSSMVLQKRLAGRINTDAAKKFYEANKVRYNTDQVRAQHILLPTEDDARKILNLAKDPKNDFQALAEKYSKDPSAKNNRGDVGFITREQFTADFTDVAFRAKVGSVVGPVKTAFGWHIIKVVDRKSGKTQGYDEVELRVRNDMMAELSRGEISRLKKGAKIER